MSEVFSSRFLLESYLEDNGITNVLQLFFLNGGVFSYVENFLDFYKPKIMKSLEIDGVFCPAEIILDGVPRIPYGDLEKYYPLKFYTKNKKTVDDQIKTFIFDMINDIIEIFDSEYDEKITRKDILLENASGNVFCKDEECFKMSFHVKVRPYDRDLCYYASRTGDSAAIDLYNRLLEKDPDKYQGILDKAVYCVNQNFRVPYAVKNATDTRPLIPVDTKTLKPLDLTVAEKTRFC